MPVIVVGADTPSGEAVIDALLPRDGEVRAFVTDADVGAHLKSRQVKVATGDVSDGSHIGGAAMRSFCAIAATEAAHDERERSFAGTPDAVVAAWAEGLRDAGVSRVIVLDDGSCDVAPLLAAADESAAVSIDDADWVAVVAGLEAAADL